jgi:hypothetical protein
MSICTTEEITREAAIDRIMKINTLVLNRDYRGVEMSSFEPNEDVEMFVNNHAAMATSIDKWTNRMLEKYMDRPFFRRDNTTNYRVVDCL